VCISAEVPHANKSHSPRFEKWHRRCGNYFSGVKIPFQVDDQEISIDNLNYPPCAESTVGDHPDRLIGAPCTSGQQSAP
jgi:hypothetical protein